MGFNLFTIHNLYFVNTIFVLLASQRSLHSDPAFNSAEMYFKVSSSMLVSKSHRSSSLSDFSTFALISQTHTLIETHSLDRACQISPEMLPIWKKIIKNVDKNEFENNNVKYNELMLSLLTFGYFEILKKLLKKSIAH